VICEVLLLDQDEIHKQTLDKDSDVRRSAAQALGSVFSHIPESERQQAWQDLHRLTQDENSYVRWYAAQALGSAFSHIPESEWQQAWQDLIRLTGDEDSYVRRSAAQALKSVFSHIPESEWQQAWQDLIRLTQDEDSGVRMYAYYSLGRAHVLKATRAPTYDILEKELETAITCFEKSSRERGVFYSPAKFCSHFYRSYFALTFRGAKEDEVQMYLAEAKEAVGGSKSKDELLKAVENLARALKEAQRLKDRPLHEVISELNAYRWYCEEAARHMDAAEDKTPIAVKLMKKCNPLLDQRINATIAEIQAQARKICQVTRDSGGVYESPGAELQKAAIGLSADDIYSIQKSSSRIVCQLEKFCSLLPPKDKEQVCEIVREIELEPDFPEKLNKILTALLCLSPILEDKPRSLADVVILTVLPEEYNSICKRLSKLGHPPDMGSVPNLYAWRSGYVFCKSFDSSYRIVVGMVGRAGTTEGALATEEAIRLWRPRYIIFSGIGGGLPDPKEKDARPTLGDVVIADVIYGYEYGKIDKIFKPRSNWVYRTDLGLMNGAMSTALSKGWRKHIEAEPPVECTPEVIRGEIASGDKVVDDPTNEFFDQVLKTWPKINAVEMEGAGAAAAIEHANSLGFNTGFMMIRGISDIPRAEGEGKGTEERDAWKKYASDVAAAFTIEWISNGLPLRPSGRN